MIVIIIIIIIIIIDDCSQLLSVVQGVLLYGPPGTGKTLLARAVAHHTECTFIRVSGSELVQKFIGEGSRMVRELFVMARSVSRRFSLPIVFLCPLCQRMNAVDSVQVIGWVVG